MASIRLAKLKMHLVLRPDLSAAAVAVATAHAGLGTYLEFEADPWMQLWKTTSFVKIIHGAVNMHQFQICRTWCRNKAFTESTLDHLEVCVGFCVEEKDHPFFADVPLWKPMTSES